MEDVESDSLCEEFLSKFDLVINFIHWARYQCFFCVLAERTVTNPCPRVPGPTAAATAAAAAGRRPTTERQRARERRAPAAEAHSPATRAGCLSAAATALQHSYLGDLQTKDTERERAGDGMRRRTVVLRVVRHMTIVVLVVLPVDTPTSVTCRRRRRRRVVVVLLLLAAARGDGAVWLSVSR